MTGRFRGTGLALALGVALASVLWFGFVETVSFVHDARLQLAVAIDPRTLSLLSLLANLVVLAAPDDRRGSARRRPGREGDR
jgi:hypothetical protein